MRHKELLRLLNENGITAVVIGGTALRLYGSPRTTYDIDLAVPLLDIDRVVDLMYANKYFLVSQVSSNACSIQLTSEEAKHWIETEKAGAASFIELDEQPSDSGIPHKLIDVATQIDFIFEPGIPFIRLKNNARIVELDDFDFYVAAPKDLLSMKENRPNKNEADMADIGFLKSLFKAE